MWGTSFARGRTSKKRTFIRSHAAPILDPFNTSAQKTELAHESKPHILPRVKGEREEDSGAYFWVVGWLAVPLGSAQMRANVYRTCI